FRRVLFRSSSKRRNFSLRADFLVFSCVSLPQLYPCVSIRVKEERSGESFDSPSPPPLGDPGTLAHTRERTARSVNERRCALPPSLTIRSGASPRLKPGGGLSPRLPHDRKRRSPDRQGE